MVRFPLKQWNLRAYNPWYLLGDTLVLARRVSYVVQALEMFHEKKVPANIYFHMLGSVQKFCRHRFIAKFLENKSIVSYIEAFESTLCSVT